MARRRTKSSTMTLKRLADALGVHASTVSRALDPRRRTLVAPDVAEKIRAAADRLGYRPDPIAASLRTRRSRLIGVLVTIDRLLVGAAAAKYLFFNRRP